MSTVAVSSPLPHLVGVVRLPWSSRRWLEFFRVRRDFLLNIPWGRGAELSDRERDLIARSVQVFQQGEAQEGRHFYRCAQEYGQTSGDSAYVDAHRAFMDEEARHGRDLARFLTLAGIPVLSKQSWLARAFCWFGSRGGLESTLRVIVISEIIALVYYAALRRATNSAVLRQLCVQILCDEKQHIRFQSERLAIMRDARFAPRLAWTRTVDAMAFAAACLVCWCGHRRVFRAGGVSFISFWRDAWHKFRHAART